MMKLIALAALVLQDDPVAAEALKGYRHAWADFGLEASVTYRESMKRPSIDAKGNLVQEPIVSEQTWTVVQVEGEKTSIRIEGGGQESVIPHYLGLPSWGRGKGERKGEEELEVSGRKVSCEVFVLAFDEGKDASQRTTISRSAAVPYWAVRRRVETRGQGAVLASEEERLLAVEEKVKVGDRELPCAVVEVTTEAVGAATTVRKEWRSDQVPGRLVRRETRVLRGGREIEEAASQMEVVRFASKR